ncbi:MAG TPA: hypothetical protein VKA84_07670 [Gemmatimonadaceae bacterium]|nr:hypothetical protein [Gemmatimonadaceae bacterium]
MGKRDQQALKGHQKGAQQHAEGTQHGEKTHEAILEQLNAYGAGEAANDAAEMAPRYGKHKIYEDREQHDEADKNAEKHRLQRDLDRNGGTDDRILGR